MNKLQKDNADRAISHVAFTAGGLIHRDTSSGPEVLIIHRSKYLAIYFLFKSETYQDVLNIQIASSYSFLVLAFISGFNERFVKRALDAAAKALRAGEEKKQEGK